ncbi:hypothetical protein ILYODFUR_018822 [Ilyodon furcidens]|uniref:Uncharacterized protein n=1 Tax=Ilyodon furcidens TaxID=33524 RepID=A0ABV0TJQ5_9TELE
MLQQKAENVSRKPRISEHLPLTLRETKRCRWLHPLVPLLTPTQWIIGQLRFPQLVAQETFSSAQFTFLPSMIPGILARLKGGGQDSEHLNTCWG